MAIDEVLGGNIVTDKQFLNDTIGTGGFKSLNKIVEDVGNSIKAEGGVRVVKRVQRGSYKTKITNSTTPYLISISKVNPDKSVLILTSGSSASSGALGTGYLNANGDKIALYWTNADPVGSETRYFHYDYDWQVVEYY